MTLINYACSCTKQCDWLRNRIDAAPRSQWYCRSYSLANRHSCSTSAETHDRKCFSMQLILVVDMINQMCQNVIILLKVIISLFCWKMISKSISKYSSNCKVCMYYEYQRLFSFQFTQLSDDSCNDHADQTLPQEFNGTTFNPLGWPLTGELPPREALFVKLLWPLVLS